MVQSDTTGHKDAAFVSAASWAESGGSHHKNASWRRGSTAAASDATLGDGPGGRRASAIEIAFGETPEGHSSWPTATLHLLTAIVGAGVLTLPNAVSWMGWALGPAAVVVFYGVALWTSMLLADIHVTSGKRHHRYLDAVLDILGPRPAAALVTLQMLTMALGCIGLLIAGSGALRMIAVYSCAYAKSKQCIDNQWVMALLFGGLQVPLSQLPNLESIWLVSAAGAAASVGYSIMGLALSASSDSKGLGSIWGRPAPPFEKAMGVFNALGDISVAYFCAMIVLEIQDTLKDKVPGDAVTGMRKALGTALTVALALYISVSTAGYSALGDTTPGSVLDATFPHSPDWVPLLANILILCHMISAFQLYAQPLFANTEAACHALLACFAARRGQKRGDGSASDPKSAPIPRGSLQERIAVRVVVRTLLVAAATLFAIVVPSFSGVIGLIGGLMFWPVGVLFPTALWAKVRRPRRAVIGVIIALNAVLLLVSLAATFGSIYQIVSSSHEGLLGSGAKQA